MAQHTPAPWKATHTWIGTIEITDAVGHRVTTIDKHHLGKDAAGIEGAAANALLIAAAPAMLAALRTVLTGSTRVQGKNSCDQNYVHLLEASLEQVKAAYDEATKSK